jgi:hypothetical protein
MHAAPRTPRRRAPGGLSGPSVAEGRRGTPRSGVRTVVSLGPCGPEPCWQDRHAASRARRSVTRFRPRFPPAVRQVHGLVEEVEDRTCVHLAQRRLARFVLSSSGFVDECGRRLRTLASAQFVTPRIGKRRLRPAERTVRTAPRWDATGTRWKRITTIQGGRGKFNEGEREAFSSVYGRSIAVRTRRASACSLCAKSGGCFR